MSSRSRGRGCSETWMARRSRSRTMRTWMVLGMLSLAGGAYAAGKKAADPDAAEARMAQMDSRAQMMMTLQLAEALELDDAATLKLRQSIAQWDAQRAPLRQQMFDQAQVLRRAAKGDTTAYGQVDQAMFQQLSQGLPPQKKAKLALAIARFKETSRGMMHGGRGGPRGEPDD